MRTYPKTNLQPLNIIKILVIFGFVIGCLTGCLDKQFAKWQIGTVEKLVLKAKDYQADIHAPNKLKQTEDSLARAKQLYDAGNYKESRTTIKTALTLAKDLFETTRQKKAEADFELAERKFRIATENEGRKTDPQLYDKLEKTRDKMRNAHTKKNYDKTIQLANEVTSGVGTLLKNVIEAANKYVNDAKAKLEEARFNEAEIRVPDAWTKAKDAVTEAENLLKQEKYLLAIDKGKSALILAETADNGALESLARDAVAKAEKLMLALEEANAKKYVPIEYNSIKGRFATAWSQFNAKDYKIAVSVAKMVENEAPSILAKAEKLRLKEMLDTAQKSIDLVRANDGEKYAPIFLAEAESLHNEAIKAYNASEYDQVKKLLDDISNKIERANDQLRLRANDEIQKAKLAIQDAQDAQATIYASDLLARAASLESLAESYLESKQYRDAIVTAQTTIEKAQEAKMAAIKRNAEISLIAAEKEISRTVGEGGDLYAIDEMKEARALLASGKEALVAQQFTKAIDIAGQVESKCAEAITTIRSKAIAKINETNTLIANVEEEKYLVARYAPDLLKQAKNLLEEANTKLAAKRYNLAFESAVASQNVAIAAKNKSIRQQIIDRTPNVQLQINEAKLAGAYGYAIEAYDKALTKLNDAQTDLQAGKFDLALQDINEAEQAAQDALNGQIHKARKAVALAKELGAWKLEPTTLQNAVIQLDLAEREMKAKRYPESLRAATAALMLADRASKDTKDTLVAREAAQIDFMLSKAVIATAFIPQRVNSLKERTEQAVTNYKKQGPAAFIATMTTFETIKNEIMGLEQLAQSVKEKETAAIQSALTEHMKLGAKEYAESEIKQVQDALKLMDIAYAAKNYQQAKIHLNQAESVMKTISLRREENSYKVALSELINRWNKAMGDFDSVIRLSPYIMKYLKGGEMAAAYKAIEPSFHYTMSLSEEFVRSSKGDMRIDPYKGLLAGQMTSSKFKQIMTDLDTNVKQLNPPPTLKELHALAVSAFAEAKVAADYFDKFGFTEQYSAEVRDKFIDSAFKNITAAWEKKSQIDMILYGPKPEKKPIFNVPFYVTEMKKDIKEDIQAIKSLIQK
ncbi:MAG: hypothetical protein N3A72_04410 [bacterium]|nr:hypothetical protein [bacterium]